ncbi:MAG: DUF2080 family transposase-associated protein [Desulfarculaceae bacterium]|nr:DUF2080 family transposase-associated protein [Desulfarculaceae bacterium]MCF8046530.1 DUF2080 family transposase-associated protein [Desulfarculaceae bacterium]MCF8064671.1 DUF2080 family transposase-associated protein [Desulfarculaceae bacterium]MCF8096209.1 DUF2080 family transposase-associated protein [Desulfarculaceae bacterium]MCF8123442.1 DUF2080 family transposase-associated protein [Desulfarculaceae bacterium]
MNPEQKPAKRPRAQAQHAEEKPGGFGGKTKFEGYGEEMLEKTVKQSGNSGRVYLPPEWVGKNVKIIRIT